PQSLRLWPTLSHRREEVGLRRPSLRLPEFLDRKENMRSLSNLILLLTLACGLAAAQTKAPTKSADKPADKPTDKPASTETTALPSEATVDAFMQQTFGYDP